MASTKDIRIIPRKEVKRSKRGRKPVVDAKLLDLLKQVPTDGESAAVLTGFANTPADSRAKVGAVIRNHWKMIHGDAPKARVEWDPESGTPQVSARV